MLGSQRDLGYDFKPKGTRSCSHHRCMMVIFYLVLLMIRSAQLNPLMAKGKETPIIEGRHFVIGTIHDPPYIVVEHTGRNISHVDGFVHQIVVWLAEKHKFTYEYVEPPDGAYGAFVNDSWNGLIRMVMAREIDIAATSLSVTYPRSQVIDYTFAFSEDPTSILIPYPRLDSTISGIIKPFQYEVWIGIVASLFTLALVLGWISRVEWNIHRQSFQGETGLISHFWFLFRVVANPNDVITFTLATRLIVAAWCLVAVVFVNSYTSILVSYLMAPKFVPAITTVKSLAESRDVTVTVLKHTSVESILLEATSGSLAKLGAQLRAHPENHLQSLDHVEDIVYNQHKAFPSEGTVLKVRIHNDFKKTKKCRLAIAKEQLFPDQHGFALHKLSNLTDVFNYDVVWLRQLGLFNHWRSAFLPGPNRCSVSVSSLRSNPQKRLTLNYLSSAFLLWGVGVVISTLAFVFERISYFRNKNVV